jgi:oligopeptide transport system permease protein
MKNKYIVWLTRRIIAMMAVVFVTITITFFMLHAIDGDPFTSSIENLTSDARQRYISYYGLDKPIFEQYVLFIKNLVLHGDFGFSLRNRSSSVRDIICAAMPTSLIVGGAALFVGATVGYLLGVWSAYSKRTWVKKATSLFGVFCLSAPIYILAPIMQSIFGVKMHLLPVSGWGDWEHLVLPVMCMIPHTIATIMKYTQSGIEQVRRSAYYMAVKQRGFSEVHIFLKHVARNSASSIVTILVSNLSAIFAGSFIVEKIFSLPGIGRQFVSAINARDYTIVLGLNFVFTGIYVIFMLIGDVIQGSCNPRYRDAMF